ncbi:MAG: RHS repeat-associated core domain-containing protein [Phycisphaerae bacterium]|nr:RHS repeat-associated core domain-containing protein [Phycisphaerae bacterium]MDD5381420.1 RHS repeat-associated core domain-containing protein [Phycisphaerae bacterium]
MRSQLTDANISNINGGNWVANYSYYKNGDMISRMIQANQTDFTYSGNQMITAGGSGLDYDENGNMLNNASAKTLEYNWDNKLRRFKDGEYVKLALKYDPFGNRIYKETADGSTKRKYIVDIVGGLPTMLMEINPVNGSIFRTYIHANGRPLMQHNGSYTAKEFYLCDRLGSVRGAFTNTGAVNGYSTYSPFGETLEENGLMWLLASFRFTGQYYDRDIGQYYFRARQYDPYISRFTSRDPAEGLFENPLMLHRYLYCGNNPINYIDLDGNFAVIIGGSASGNLTIGGASSLTSGFGLMGYYIGVLSYCSQAIDMAGVGGTAGAGIFFGKNTEETGWLNTSGWFWGDIGWAAAGGSVGMSGASFTADFSFSPNAMKASDLEGWYTEYGGSVTFPAPVGSPFWFATGAFSYSVSDNGTKLYTLSGGPGLSTWGVGGEGHIYRGRAWVNEW